MYQKNLVKFLKIIDLLSHPNGTTIQEIAEKLNVTHRSVYRILETLQEINFPLYDELGTGHKKRWKMEESFLSRLPNVTLPDVSLSRMEVFLLFYFLSGEDVFKNTEIEPLINSLKAKLVAFIPEKLKDRMSICKLDDVFANSTRITKNYSGKEEIIEDIADAIVARETCVIRYHAFSSDQIKKFRIDPLKLFEYDGGLYVFVRITKFNSIKVIAVERILELTMLGENFKYPHSFEAEELLRSSFGITIGEQITAKIWFSADQARYIKERMWAPDQHIEEQDDGSVVITVNTSGVFDVKKWVLSYGSSAKVLEPGFLADEIEDEIEKMKKNYQV